MKVVVIQVNLSWLESANGNVNMTTIKLQGMSRPVKDSTTIRVTRCLNAQGDVLRGNKGCGRYGEGFFRSLKLLGKLNKTNS